MVSQPHFPTSHPLPSMTVQAITGIKTHSGSRLTKQSMMVIINDIQMHFLKVPSGTAPPKCVSPPNVSTVIQFTI